MTCTRIRGRFVVASDGTSHHILEEGEVVYEGDRIIFTGHDYPDAVDEDFNAGNAVVGPGFIDTPLVRASLSPEALAHLETEHAAGRLGTDAEVAALTLFLLSDDASFISGSYHLVDGGYSAH